MTAKPAFLDNNGFCRKWQQHMFYQAERNAAQVSQTFLELVQDGLTREELARNIKRRPTLWGRFSSWLDKLPSRPI